MNEISSTPLSRYQQDLQDPEFDFDPAQQMAVEQLQGLYDRLVADANKRKPWWPWAKQKEAQKGIYFWGGVGRGKTYLVDAFYECLPFAEKKRTHFHRFMQKIHHERKLHKDLADPITHIGEQLGRRLRVLCFDEFVVHDVADAVILAKLLDALLHNGVSLVATSNVKPDDLYLNGLQRDLFMPAIHLIKQQTKVINLDSGVDYRLRFLDRAEIFFCPHDDQAEQGMHYNFEHLAPDAGERNTEIEIESRSIPVNRRADGVIWFNFLALCDGPRSQNDYLELARCFHSILISDIAVMDRLSEDRAKRFILLIDILYDHNVNLIASFAAPIEDIYTGTRNAFEFERTRSRLQEMQSHDYLAQQHRTE